MKEKYASITSRRGGGTYRYLGGIFSNAVYGTIAPGTAHVTPTDPGPFVIPTGSTNINTGNINRDHSEACMEHKEWVNLERAGKNQITELVTKTFLAGVFNRNQGFAHIRVREIITYLFAEYGQVEYQDLMGNRSKLSDPCDTNFPLQELVQRVQEIQEFATDGGRTITDDNILDKMYTIVYNNGLFYNDCDKCDNKERSDKTWANFQAHLQAEHRK